MIQSDEVLRQEDQEARQLAKTNFSQPLVLEAGAGTGKTATLVARVLCWALGPGWLAKSDLHADFGQERIAASVLDGIVAITFTEKASVEMSERLAQATLSIIAGEAVVGIDPQDLPSPTLAASRAKSILSQLDRVHIETIHAFCRRTLADNALAAGLHPAFEVDADGTLVAHAMVDVLAQWLTEDLDGEVNPESAHLITKGFGATRIEETLSLIINANLPTSFLEADPYPDDVCAHTAKDLSDLLRTFVRFCHPALTTSKKKLLDRAKNCVLSLNEIADKLANSKSADELMVSMADFDLSGTHKKIIEWSKKGPNKTEATALRDDSLNPEELQDLSKNLLPALKSISSWDPETLRPAFRLLSRLTTQVRAKLRQQGVLTFNNLLLECRNLLRDHEGVLRKMQEGMDQLLVDEVQDTDPLQYDIVRSLAFDGDNGPNLFVVGDPKQTIYGFRGADLGAYGAFIREIESHGGQRRSLSVNFRSDPPILDEVERIVEPVMQFKDGLQPEFEKLLCPTAKSANCYQDAHGRRPIEFWNSWARFPRRPEESHKIAAKTSADRARHIEAAAIAKEIHQLHHQDGKDFSSFAILMRATTQQETYLAALRDLGIPYLVEKDKQFYKRREVIDATNALTAILDPFDQVAMLGFLRSNFVGVPDAMLLPLWQRSLPQKLSAIHGRHDKLTGEILSLIDEVDGLPRGNIPGLERLPNWALLLKKSIHDIGLLRASFQVDSVDLFFTKLKRHLLIEAQESARFLGTHRLANIQRFFDLAQDLLARPDLGRGEALRLIRSDMVAAIDMEEASPGDETSDAVRVMSVHKSKGLDFDHVYFVALHQGHRGGSPGDRVLHRPGTWGVRFFGAETPKFNHLTQHDEAVSRAETIRALYVAVTRASHRLVLCGLWPEDSKEVKELGECNNIVDLLRHRRGVYQGWLALSANEDLTNPVKDCSQGDHVSWILPDHHELENRHVGVATKEDVPKYRGDLEELRKRQEAAASFVSVASPLKASELPPTHVGPVTAKITETSALLWPSHLPESVSQVANKLGTAIHWVLETIPLDEGTQEHLASSPQALSHFFDRQEFATHQEAICQAFSVRIKILKEGPLLAKLQTLSSSVLGREIPLLVRQGEVDVVGSLDLLYRDPGTDQLVVVDFKTDQLKNEEELKARAEKYGAQGAAYCEAVAGTFPDEKMPPRFELWFLTHNAVVCLE